MLKLDINKIGVGGNDSDSDQSELMEIRDRGRESPGVIRVQAGNGQVTEVPEEGPECYTNQSFSFLEHFPELISVVQHLRRLNVSTIELHP